MKAVTDKKIIGQEGQRDLLTGFMMHLSALVCGLIFAIALIPENMFPFGVAYVGGVKHKYIPASTAGALAGYLIKVGSGGFLYIAAVFAVASIRKILGEKSRFMGSAFFLSVITFSVMSVMGAAAVATYGENITGYIGQAAISAVTTYFICIFSNIYLENTSGLDLPEMVSVVFTVSVFLLSLYGLKPLGLSLGRILAVTVILSAARFGRASYGAVSGVVVCFTLAISGGETINTAFVFAFSGLMCGMFSRFGSVGIISAYICTCISSLMVVGEYTLLPKLFFEAVIGGGIFLTFPKKLCGYFGNALSPSSETIRTDSVKNALIMRLEFAGGALKDVYETVEEVAEKLSEINNPDFEKTLRRVENDVCIGCSLRKHCWETAKELTVVDALDIWKGHKYPRKENSKEEKLHNCLRQKKFKGAVEKHLYEYENRCAAENRLSEIRGVVSDQFEGISDMLFDLSEEFRYEVRHNAPAAENIILTMKNLGFHAVNCIAATDKFGRLSVDIHIRGTADRVVNKMEIMHNLSLAVGRDMDTPSVSVGNDEAFIFITEKPIYKVEVGLTQIPESTGKLSGDSCKYFNDGRGRFIMLLSDGMGCGGRAAVDSSMVSGLMSRMIRSGFGYDCALKIVNSSMLFKSTDESLSTVDISSIDLFTGECEMLKAGAAPTVVRRQGRVGKAESNSLPPGILRNINLDKAKIKLKAEDIVVMMSDGATTEGEQWICDIVGNWTIGSAQQLADEIAFAARRRRNDGHSDDITVMTAILKKP